MEKGKTLAKALSGVLVGGMLLSGGVVFAQNNDNQTDSKPSIRQAAKGYPGTAHRVKAERQQTLQTALEQLAQEGVLTREQVSQIKAQLDQLAKERQARRDEFKKLSPEQRKALREKRDNNQAEAGRKGQFSQLVKNNVITQAQADAIKNKMQEIAAQQRQQRVSDGLKSLVQKGTISQDQSNKVQTALDKAQKDRAALFEKLKGMTKEERRQYMRDNRGAGQNPLKQLVSDGTLTQDQAKAIRKALLNDKG